MKRSTKVWVGICLAGTMGMSSISFVRLSEDVYLEEMSPSGQYNIEAIRRKAFPFIFGSVDVLVRVTGPSGDSTKLYVYNQDTWADPLESFNSLVWDEKKGVVLLTPGIQYQYPVEIRLPTVGGGVAQVVRGTEGL